MMAYVHMLAHVLKYPLAGCCFSFVGVVIGADVECVGLHELQCVHRL